MKFFLVIGFLLFSGLVTARPENRIVRLDSKKVPSSLKETYSDLYILPRLHPSKNFSLSLKFRISKQHRAGLAQPWETFWIFWSYIRTGDGLKETNYLALKTNGLEIGWAFGIVEQKFSWTIEKPFVEINRWSSLELIFLDSEIKITLDGQVVQVPYEKLKFNVLRPGRLGLYTEDAQVEIKEIDYQNLAD